MLQCHAQLGLPEMLQYRTHLAPVPTTKFNVYQDVLRRHTQLRLPQNAAVPQTQGFSAYHKMLGLPQNVGLP